MPRGSAGTGRTRASQICGCSSAGRARPRHGRGPGFESRLPLHFRVCPCTTRHARAVGTAKRGCARGRSPCAARAPGRLADHSRSDTAESGSRRVRLAGQGCRAFIPATRVRFPYTTPDQKSCALTRKAETGRKDWAAPELVTGTHLDHRGSLAQWKSVSLSRRGPRVRSPHGPPCQLFPFSCRNSSEVERCVEGAGVGVSKTPCGTTFDHFQHRPASSVEESTGLRSRGSHVRIVRGAPTNFSTSFNLPRSSWHAQSSSAGRMPSANE
jgi:hypothetical protein